MEFAGWASLGFSIMTVFLPACPHNRFEIRFFLSRMPARSLGNQGPSPIVIDRASLCIILELIGICTHLLLPVDISSQIPNNMSYRGKGKAFGMSLAELVNQIQAAEGRTRSGPTPIEGSHTSAVSTGWEPVDAHMQVASDRSILPGLACGVVHEWFRLTDSSNPQRQRGRDWKPPIIVLTHLALRAFSLNPTSRLVWIGRQCWPTLWHVAPSHVDLGKHMLSQSVFVDPPSCPARLWSIDLAVRCPSVSVVVGDGSGLNLAATRRLQVASATGQVLTLLTRPAYEIKELSAATTRWRVSPSPSPTRTSRFELELLRCKMPQQVRGGLGNGKRWLVESDSKTGVCSAPSFLADRPAQTSVEEANAQTITV